MNNSEKAWKRNSHFGNLIKAKIYIGNILIQSNELIPVEYQELHEINDRIDRLLTEKNNRWEIYRKINKMGKYAEPS